MADEADIAALYQSGLTLREIADKTGRPFTTLYGVLNRAGVKRRPRGHRPRVATSPKAAEAVRLRALGSTFTEIAAELGLASGGHAYRYVQAAQAATD